MMIKKALLAVMAAVFVLIALEASFRIKALRDDRKSLSGMLNYRVPSLLGRKTSLGDLIQVSPNPLIIYELKPNLSFFFAGMPVEINRSGFRGHDHPVRKAPGTVRVVGLGDSVMFGWGVSNECAFPSRLEARLNQEHPGARWEVINTAVPGYNTVIELAVLKEKGLKYSPDLVLLNFVGNDLGLPGFIHPRQDYSTLKKSFLLTFLRTQGRYIRQSKKTGGNTGSSRTPRRATSYFGEACVDVPEAYQPLVGWDAFNKALTELKHLSDNRGFQVLVVFFGDAMPDRVKALCASLDMDCLEPFPAYLHAHQLPRYFDSPLCLGRKDPHPSALGHEVGAEAIYGYLETNGLLAALESKATGHAQ